MPDAVRVGGDDIDTIQVFGRGSLTFLDSAAGTNGPKRVFEPLQFFADLGDDLLLSGVARLVEPLTMEDRLSENGHERSPVRERSRQDLLNHASIVDGRL